MRCYEGASNSYIMCKTNGCTTVNDINAFASNRCGKLYHATIIYNA